MVRQGACQLVRAGQAAGRYKQRTDNVGVDVWLHREDFLALNDAKLLHTICNALII